MEEKILGGLEHPDAYNPALIKWKGRILLMYRVGIDNAELFYGELSEDFTPKGKFQKVLVPEATACEDPRFFIHRERLYFSFVILQIGIPRVGLGMVNDDLSIQDCHTVLGSDALLSEKNWIFFSHQEQLFLTYAMSEGVHQVYRVKGDRYDRCEPAYTTCYEDPWKWGIARGGTQLIEHEGLWYGFFHGTASNYEDLDRRYFMGAFAVAPEPPFPIVKMSKSPLYTPPESRLHPKTRDRPAYRKANVFPSGLINEGGSWLVCAGYNNHRIKIFRISHKELTTNLVSTLPEKKSASETTRPVCVHVLPKDPSWIRSIDFVQKQMTEGEPVFADIRFIERHQELVPQRELTEERLRKGINWVILHKDYVYYLDPHALEGLRQKYLAVFANEVFVVFTNKLLPEWKADFDQVHLHALWEKVDAFPMKDRYWTDTARFILDLLGNASIIAPFPFTSFSPANLRYEWVSKGDEIEDRFGIVIHKGDLQSLPTKLLRFVKDSWKCVFANEVFLVYVRPESSLPLADLTHQISFFESLERLELA